MSDCSSNSIEVIEFLQEAAQEDDVNLGENQVSDAMTTSQFAQVIFHDVADSYPNDCDVVCQYTLTQGMEPSHGDRVALYKLPYLDPHDSLTYCWAPMPQVGCIRIHGLGLITLHDAR